MASLFQQRLPALCDEVNGAIAAFLDARAQTMPDLDHPGFGRVYQSVYAYLRNGGKRFHGVSMLLAYRSTNAGPAEAILPVVVGFQLYHHHTMVHDDVYDEDSYRRGSPTIHHAFKQWFAGLGVSDEVADPADGDRRCKLFLTPARRKGAIAGWIQGKVVHALAFEALASAPFPKDKLFEVMQALNWHSVHDNAGQFKDVFHERSQAISPAEALDIALAKSGRLYGTCVDAASLLSGATPSQREALRSWITDLGTVYQLQDDIADLNADSEKGQGRGIGADVDACKPTLLLALALQRADAADRRLLLDWIADRNRHPMAVSQYHDILQRSGAAAHCQAEAERLVQRSHEALLRARPALPGEYFELMCGLGRYLASADYWNRRVPARTEAFAAGLAPLREAAAAASPAALAT